MKSVIFLVCCLFFPSEANGIGGWSDVDVETMMVKIEATAIYYDVDNDDQITMDDFQHIMDRLEDFNHYSDEKKEEVRTFIRHLWSDAIGVSAETPVSLKQFVVKILTLIHNGHMTNTEVLYRSKIFEIIDNNKDQLIHVDEFLEFAESVGYVNNAKQTAAFKVIDKNGDGQLTGCEYVTAYLLYFTDPTIPHDALPLF